MAFPAYAAQDWGATAPNGVATIGSLQPLIQNIISATTAFAGIVLFIMLVIGGLTFIFSGGDQKQIEKAKGTITSAVIGLVVFVSAYLILALLKTWTGVNVTDFFVKIN